MEIKIGRKVTGDNAIIIPESFKKVSRVHATVVYDNGLMRIVDEDSTHGTYIKGDGVRVAEKELKKGDVLLLGGCDEYDPMVFSISYDDIKKKFDEILCANKTDYSEEFAALKVVYENYNTEVNRLKEKARKKAAQQRVAIMSVGILISVVGVLAHITYLGSAVVLSGLVAGLIIKPTELKEEIIEINLKYRHDYRCPNPKCGKEYSLGFDQHHWKILRDSGCPYCKAKFRK